MIIKAPVNKMKWRLKPHGGEVEIVVDSGIQYKVRSVAVIVFFTKNAVLVATCFFISLSTFHYGFAESLKQEFVDGANAVLKSGEESQFYINTPGNLVVEVLGTDAEIMLTKTDDGSSLGLRYEVKSGDRFFIFEDDPRPFKFRVSFDGGQSELLIHEKIIVDQFVSKSVFEARKLYMKGLSYVGDNSDSGQKNRIELFKQSRSMLRSIQSPSLDTLQLLGDINFGIVEAMRYQGDLDGAELHARESIHYLQQISGKPGLLHSYIWLGSVLVLKGEYQQARNLLGKIKIKSKRLNDPFRGCQASNLVAFSFYKDGTYNEAESEYNKTISCYKSLNNIERTSKAYFNLARLYFSWGRLHEARTLLEQHVELANKHGNRDVYLSLHYMAKLELIVGNYQEALKQQLKSLDKLTDHEDLFLRAQANHQLGLIYAAIGNQSLALHFFDVSIGLNRKSKNLSGIAETLLESSKVVDKQQAIMRLDRAKQIFMKLGNTQKTEFLQLLAIKHQLPLLSDTKLEVNVLNTLVKSEFENTRTLASGLLAKIACSEDDEARCERFSAQAITGYQKSMNLNDLALIFLDKARHYFSQKKLDMALDAIKSSMKALSLSDRNLHNNSLKSYYRHSLDEVYDFHLTLVQAKESEITSSAVSSLLLYEQYLAKHFQPKYKFSEDLVRVDKLKRQIRAKYYALQESDQDKHMVVVSARLRRDLAILHSRLDALEQDDDLDDSYSDPVKSSRWLNELQSRLALDEAILEYSLTKRAGHLWIVTRNSIRHISLENPEQLVESVRRVKALIELPPSARVSSLFKASFSLSKKIFPEELDLASVRKIYVAAIGELQRIPLDYLASVNNKYKLKKTFSRIHSTKSLLTNLSRTSKANSSKKMAIFADPLYHPEDQRIEESKVDSTPSQILNAITKPENLTSYRSAKYSRLIFSGKSAKIISNIAMENNYSTAVFLGEEANRANLLNLNLSSYNILHFATHGIVDLDFPSMSGLVLSAYNVSGEPQYAYLQQQDIEALSLDSSLVVLSACDTEVGKLLNGGGMLGLGRSFVNAGAKQVLSTLWKIDDLATTKLMQVFYQEYLGGGLPVAESLNIAKAKLSSNPRWRDPHYWAGFQLSGLMGP